uniref:Uncharacterized protein n=1 Tax=viral metagenome TaxID=1070528 RepID=A0A6M3KUN2_9ZZZZ
MENIKLIKPKVKDLVKLLLSFDQEKEIIISDADTGWTISIIHFEEYNGKIEMAGAYGEMNND